MACGWTRAFIFLHADSPQLCEPGQHFHAGGKRFCASSGEGNSAADKRPDWHQTSPSIITSTRCLLPDKRTQSSTLMVPIWGNNLFLFIVAVLSRSHEHTIISSNSSGLITQPWETSDNLCDPGPSGRSGWCLFLFTLLRAPLSRNHANKTIVYSQFITLCRQSPTILHALPHSYSSLGECKPSVQTRTPDRPLCWAMSPTCTKAQSRRNSLLLKRYAPFDRSHTSWCGVYTRGGGVVPHRSNAQNDSLQFDGG